MEVLRHFDRSAILYVVANESSEVRWLRFFGQKATYRGRNLYFRGGFFTLDPKGAKRHDAVYGAAMEFYKWIQSARRI